MSKASGKKGPWPQATAFLKRLVRNLPPIHVVDVGANPIEGDAPYQRLLSQGLCHVVGFEPQEGPYEALLAQKSANETYFRAALGSGGKFGLHLFHHSGFTSLFGITDRLAKLFGFVRATRETGVVEIETTRLDDLAGVERIDYLKIDVQGAERDIIAAGRAKLAQAVLVQTEVRFVPLYAGEPCFAGLDQELQAQGFLFHDFAFLKRVPLVSRHSKLLRPLARRQVLDGDAYYVRDLSRPDLFSDEQLLRLCLLADMVMQDAELVVFCLDELEGRKAVAKGSAQRYCDLLPSDLKRAE